ncbi:MAG: hypothetical protein WDW38_005005 [Sanguina aurantia]
MHQSQRRPCHRRQGLERSAGLLNLTVVNTREKLVPRPPKSSNAACSAPDVSPTHSRRRQAVTSVCTLGVPPLLAARWSGLSAGVNQVLPPDASVMSIFSTSAVTSSSNSSSLSISTCATAAPDVRRSRSSSSGGSSSSGACSSSSQGRLRSQTQGSSSSGIPSSQDWLLSSSSEQVSPFVPTSLHTTLDPPPVSEHRNDPAGTEPRNSTSRPETTPGTPPWPPTATPGSRGATLTPSTRGHRSREPGKRKGKHRRRGSEAAGRPTRESMPAPPVPATTHSSGVSSQAQMMRRRLVGDPARPGPGGSDPGSPGDLGPTRTRGKPLAAASSSLPPRIPRASSSLPPVSSFSHTSPRHSSPEVTAQDILQKQQQQQQQSSRSRLQQQQQQQQQESASHSAKQDATGWGNQPVSGLIHHRPHGASLGPQQLDMLFPQQQQQQQHQPIPSHASMHHTTAGLPFPHRAHSPQQMLPHQQRGQQRQQHQQQPLPPPPQQQQQQRSVPNSSDSWWPLIPGLTSVQTQMQPPPHARNAAPPLPLSPTHTS